MERQIKRKPKLVFDFRHNHLIPLVGFRVDLHEDRNPWGRMDESVCFDIIKVTPKKMIVRMWHLLYDKNLGEQCEDSLGLYEVDLTKSFNEHNVKYLKQEFDNAKKRRKKSKR